MRWLLSRRWCATPGTNCGPSWLTSRIFGATTGVTCLSGRLYHCSQRSGSTTRHCRICLLTGDWQGAHVATKKALCAAAGRAFGSTEPPSELYVEYMDTLPCADVCTIDKLWRWASAGRFGFAVQLAIYRNLGGTDRFAFDIWQAFCYHTGWIVREPICAISAPLGHLPWLARPDTMELDSHDALVWSVDCDEEADWRFLYGIFYQRIEHCLAQTAMKAHEEGG